MAVDLLLKMLRRRTTSSNNSPLSMRLVVLLSLASLASTQQITCPDGSTGYGDICGLNHDINGEVQRIQDGGDSKLLYLYRLCPGVEMNMTEPLVPKLDGSVFRCGNSGLPAEDCKFSGGLNQVIIQPSKIPSLPLQDVRIEGVTFTGFTETAISGEATDVTTVSLEEIQFIAFDATFAIKQGNSLEGKTPFSVDIFGGSVVGAGGIGSVFSNDGGSLTIEQVSVVDSNDVMALVATGGRGATIARDITISGGTIADVFSIVGGGTLMASGISIQDMTFIKNGFEIQGSNSRATISNTNFMTNTRLPPAQKWQGISVVAGGSAVVSSTAFINNRQMLAVLSAVGEGAILMADEITIESVSGTTADDSVTAAGVIYANANGKVTMSRATINRAQAFTALIFSNQGSSVTVSQSCFEAGTVDAVVYQSEESMVTSVGNFIDEAGIKSGICRTDGLRTAIEKPGSNCFEGGTPCEWSQCLARSSLQPGFQAPFNATLAPNLPNVTSTFPPTVPTNNGTLPPFTPPVNGTATNGTVSPIATLAPTVTPTLLQATAPPVIGNATVIPGNATLPPVGNVTLVPSPGGNATIVPGVNATLPPAGNATLLPTPGGNATLVPGINATLPPVGNATIIPTLAPVENATFVPGGNATIVPSLTPGGNATIVPGNATIVPSNGNATFVPTNATIFPTFSPGNVTFPTLSPANATLFPTVLTNATPVSTAFPTASPAPTTTSKPTPSEPTLSPVVPSPSPTIEPTTTPGPTAMPSVRPSTAPTISSQPSLSSQPSFPPSISFSPTTSAPSASPTAVPSLSPSGSPTTLAPSYLPSSAPSAAPSKNPSAAPSALPSIPPTRSPAPSGIPTEMPSSVPSTSVPSYRPSPVPSLNLAAVPTNPPATASQCDCRLYWFDGNSYFGNDPINYGDEAPTNNAAVPTQMPPPPPYVTGTIVYPPKQPKLGSHKQRRRTRSRPNVEVSHHRLKGATAFDLVADNNRRLKDIKGSKKYSYKLPPPLPPPIIPQPSPIVPQPPFAGGNGGTTDPCWYYCKWLSFQDFDVTIPASPPVSRGQANPPDGGYHGPKPDGDASFFH
ncbi:hypothetical protein MPSEU_000037900 [Mayamaea pseudoterrestris]|nr:hypothetical protein MPSEU_000037900 [Mayamaea pseudoterrestris]